MSADPPTGTPPPEPREGPPKRRGLVERSQATIPQTCERCGFTMFDRHCKVLCPNCGYMRDCSDP